MIAPYLYYHEPFDAGIYRLWLAGTDRLGAFKIAGPIKVVTTDPNAWLANNPESALDELDAGQGAILKIAGRIKQLDDDPDIAWQEIRDERNERLTASDWFRDYPDFNEVMRELYEAYQKKLRDIPQLYDSPYGVIWPDEPTIDDIPIEPPEWLPTYNRIKTLAQSAVGVDLGLLTNDQIKALLAVLLHEHSAFGSDGTIRPLGEWVKRRQ